MMFDSYPGVPVVCYPITTRIHDFSKNGRHYAFRYRKWINKVLEKIGSEAHTTESLSVHQIVLQAIHNSAFSSRDGDLLNVVHGYTSRHDSELRALFTANDIECDRLLHELDFSVREVRNILPSTYGSNEDPEDILHGYIRVPRVPQNASLTRMMISSREIRSDIFRSLRGSAFASRRIYNTMEDTSAFKLDMRTILNVHPDARWIWVPMLNAVENIPYTDLVLRYSGGVMDLVHGHSMFGKVDKVLVEYKLPDLATQLRYLVTLLYLGIDPLNFSCTITKTFSEDIYVELTCHRTGRAYRFYFDLTIAALGSRGLIPISACQELDRFSVAIRDVNNLGAW